MVGKRSSRVGLPRPTCYSHPSKRKGTSDRRDAAEPLFLGVIGKISVAGEHVANRQWHNLLDPGSCQNLMTNNMEHL